MQSSYMVTEGLLKKQSNDFLAQQTQQAETIHPCFLPNTLCTVPLSAVLWVLVFLVPRHFPSIW